MKRLIALLLLFALVLWASVVYETTFEGEANPSTYQFADSTDFACSGSESAKSSTLGQFIQTSITSTNPYWIRFYVYLTAYPAAQAEVASFALGGGFSRNGSMYMNTDGTIYALSRNGSGATSTEVVPLNTWTMLELYVDSGQSAGSDIATVRMNGVQIVSDTTGSVTNSSNGWRIFNPQSTGSFYVEDVAVENAAYPGFSAGCGDTTPAAGGRRRVMVGD